MPNLSCTKLIQLGILLSLILLSHLAMCARRGQPNNPGNVGKRCGNCLDLHLQGRGPAIPLQQRTQLPQGIFETLSCAILQSPQEGCHRDIQVQEFQCRLCGWYAWVPTGDCPVHPRAPPIYCDSNDINIIKQGEAVVDTELRL
ncbi:hypothetical protein PGT21_008601 [Puccinia graminis f. sp. tritici]|uniref:Uncharacterized protein n=1 Tax=Puccinia graminis f. sp. tritici TaxID=56615 RepID=A0A5B0M2V2_PUCGR|nr:hypothetical protein PGTUg99_032221 [Puccinia graminis f. sp. tritici]KAA1071467.1 hypothetical protein PGT21_008601 [Puccinia graminis f. sp. tritici]